MVKIETLRVMATFFLVAFHVIGTSAHGGMKVPDSSAWRIFADLMLDFRMPMFAFIAGAVYAIRPLSLDRFGQFVVGKFHRLVVPGLIASWIFWIIGNSVFGQSFTTGTPLLEVLFLTSGHFWFLQAILLIFLVFGIIDAALGYRHAFGLFLVAILLTLAVDYLPFPNTELIEARKSVYLMPYFIAGVLLVRDKTKVSQNRLALLALAAALGCIGFALNLQIFAETGALSKDRFDVQSLCLGLGVTVLCFLAFPNFSALEKIGVYTFTIYLYHALGTSMARRIFEAFDVDSLLLRFTAGVALGVLLPCAIHLIASKNAMASRLLLGLRPKSAGAMANLPLRST